MQEAHTVLQVFTFFLCIRENPTLWQRNPKLGRKRKPGKSVGVSWGVLKEKF